MQAGEGIEKRRTPPVNWAATEGLDLSSIAYEWFQGIDKAYPDDAQAQAFSPERQEEYRRWYAAVGNLDLANEVFSKRVDRALGRIAAWHRARAAESLSDVETEGEEDAMSFVAATFGHVKAEIYARDKDVDRLTGLLRYEAFQDRLRRRYDSLLAIDVIEVNGRQSRPFLGIMVDGDDFGTINKQWGHSQGDEVIEVLAHPFHKLRLEDLKTRRGGDEFAAALFGLTPEQAEEVCNRFAAELAVGYRVPILSGGFVKLITKPEYVGGDSGQTLQESSVPQERYIQVTATTAAVYAPDVRDFNHAMEVLQTAEKVLAGYKQRRKNSPAVPLNLTELVHL